MIGFVRSYGVRLVVVAALVWWAAAGGPMLAPLMWALTAYVLWRAWPAVRLDLGRLFSGGRRSRGRRSVGLL